MSTVFKENLLSHRSFRDSKEGPSKSIIIILNP